MMVILMMMVMMTNDYFNDGQAKKPVECQQNCTPNAIMPNEMIYQKTHYIFITWGHIWANTWKWEEDIFGQPAGHSVAFCGQMHQMHAGTINLLAGTPLLTRKGERALLKLWWQNWGTFLKDGFPHHRWWSMINKCIKCAHEWAVPVHKGTKIFLLGGWGTWLRGLSPISFNRCTRCTL